jgi:peptidoglycan/LPS O-acetylase OafA/YrhL
VAAAEGLLPAPQKSSGGARRPAGRHARPRSDPRSPAYRADIEGLRAVAVLGVLIYHAGASFLPGGFVGVDVFFVISGYLITGLIHDEIARTGRLSLPRFYARRVKRLLPAGAAVLTLTAIASSFLLPPIERRSVGVDIIWSALYGANWRFASEQTDYLNQDALPSPVLHYWSLAVEEQYYFVWPVLLGVLGAVMVRRRGSLRFAMFSAMAVVGVLSLALSLHLTATNQPFAFFGTPARVWELALGGCLALAAPRVGTVRPFIRAIVGWVGLLVVVGSMLVIEESATFPGTVALWPTLGTAAVLFAGTSARSRRRRQGRTGPAVVLDRGFMRHTGRISYSLYLWHWPPLVLVAAMLEREELGLGLGLVVLAVTWPVAWMSWALLEEPFRRSRVLADSPRRALGVAGVCMAAAVASAMLLLTSGAATTLAVAQDDGRVVSVDPANALKDMPESQEACLVSPSLIEVRVCSHGPEDAEHTVALFGDSHAAQWTEAFEDIVDERGWRLLVITKASCLPGDTVIWHYGTKRPYDQCTRWSNDAVAKITDPDGGLTPDVVVVTSRSNVALASERGKQMSPERSLGGVVDALEGTYRALTDAGIEVLAMATPPESDADVPRCLSANPGNTAKCAFAPDAVTLPVRPEKLAAERVGVDYLDTTGLVCDERCEPVQNGTVVYRDTNHLTNSFVTTIRERLEKRLDRLSVFEVDRDADGSQA